MNIAHLVVDEQKLKVAMYLFGRHGDKVVFLGRFVSVLRTYAAFLAGVTRMRWQRFMIANIAGGITWAGVYTFTGYYAGAAIQRASGTITLITGIVAAAAIITGMILARRRLTVLADRAELAYPGPLP